MPDQDQASEAEARGSRDRKVWVNRMLSLVVAVGILVAFGVLRWNGCQHISGTNLLSGLTPVRTEAVSNAQVLTDGTRAVDGDHWKSKLTAVFARRSASVDYDLGQTTPIVAAYLQGDNNDEYVVSVSEDGKTFTPLWTAQPDATPGLRPRFAVDLKGSGRYVRISTGRGDGSYSLSEVQLFSTPPGAMPPPMRVERGLPAGETVRAAIILFALALAFLLFATWQGAPLHWWGLCLLFPILTGVEMIRALADAWPVEARDVSFVRATVAGVAALAVLREVVLRRHLPASKPVVFGTLALTGVAAFMAFFNLGHPQFYDAKAQAPLYVHNFDMRVYYPVAKYFPELRFDGLYKGSVAAYVDDDPSVTLDSLDRVELRDLKTHHMRRVGEIKDEIPAIRKRFSDERWAEFKDDMRYFRETMGRRDYLGSMKDHGGNATPVWIAIAHLLFAHTHASNATLMAGAALDPILLLIAFFAIWRTFGWRSMFMAMLLFGANDFYMFGSDWGGATLRHDWMAYLGLGICALKKRWWMAGGALLALSAAIRAFPACAFVGLLGPPLWWGGNYYREHRRLPPLSVFIQEQKPLLKVYAGAAIASVVLFLFSSLLFTFDAWTEWLAKVRLLDRDPHVNHISWRALVAGSDHDQLRILNARMPVFVAGIAVAVGAVMAVGRSQRLYHAAAMGLLLIPMIFNPANYYAHFVFVLPVLACELGRREAARTGRPEISVFDAGVWIPLLVMCVGLYWTVLEKDLELHFQMATAVYFVAVVSMVAVLLRRDFAPVLAIEGGGTLLPVDEDACCGETGGPQTDDSEPSTSSRPESGAEEETAGAEADAQPPLADEMREADLAESSATSDDDIPVPSAAPSEPTQPDEVASEPTEADDGDTPKA